MGYQYDKWAAPVFSDVEIGVRMCSHRSQEKGAAGGWPVKGNDESLIVHGAAVAFAGRGVLILGASGAGKSGLALALIGRGATLVADDRVVLTRRGGALIVRAPEALAGLIEARGVGILRVPAVPEVPLALAVDLDHAPAARMPQRRTITYHDIKVELIFGRDIPNLDVVLSIFVQNGRAFPD
jgi:HPr kinase/phosphorylase